MSDISVKSMKGSEQGEQRLIGAPTPWRHMVIGYGCTLRGDDGIGQCVAELLRDSNQWPHVEVQARHILVPELAIDLAETHHVLFVDADARLEPLTWRIQPIVPAHLAATILCGHLQPTVLLTLTQALYGRRPKSYLFRIGASYFDFDTSLSLEMKRSLPQLVDEARRFVSGWPQLVTPSPSKGHDEKPLPPFVPGRRDPSEVVQ